MLAVHNDQHDSYQMTIDGYHATKNKVIENVFI